MLAGFPTVLLDVWGTVMFAHLSVVIALLDERVHLFYLGGPYEPNGRNLASVTPANTSSLSSTRIIEEAFG